MFDTQIYVQRRKHLKQQLSSGLLLFPGNNESPMNYPDNAYRFRQDSSFLYYFGLDFPGLAAVMDLDTGSETIYGDDLTVDEVVWMGPQPTMRERCAKVGVQDVLPANKFADVVQKAAAKGREVHFLPQYRGDTIILLADILGLAPKMLNGSASQAFIRAVVLQRSVKAPEEVAEIEIALDITHKMHIYAMKMTTPGVVEQEIAGALEGIALTRGNGVPYPVIFSVHGETLHNHYHGNLMREGDIVLNDSGASSPLHYAGDITRTIPVSGKFTQRQKEIYEIVFDAMETSIAQIKPGMKFRDVHLHAGKVICNGLKSLGLMQGDTEAAIAAGAHALFMPHGLGHMIGLDVHDMEVLGEDIVGYDEQTQRSEQFGLAYLRLAKELQPGFELTVEPGIYFIPELIDMWQGENKHGEFINYEAVQKYRGFGGIRIEENVLVTDSGQRILGKPIPKTIADVQALCSS